MSSRIDPEPVQMPPAAIPLRPRATGSRPPSMTEPAAPPVATSFGTNADRGAIALRFFQQAPAWAISMLVHVITLLTMELMVSDPPKKPVVRQITSPTSETSDEFTEFQEQLSENLGVAADPTAEVAFTTETMEAPVEVVTDATDTAVTSLAVELTDFASETAPASEMMASIGALGSVAGGIGGRTQAANLAITKGGGADTEQAVDRALQWIGTHQHPDGGWSFDFRECPSCMGRCSHSGTAPVADRCGATAMALLPYLGRGYTHREGKHQKTVEGGIAYLAALTAEGNGKAYRDGGTLYSQGLAGIALCECYAMTQDSRLAGPAQLALNYIMQAQDPVGGGWRYAPRQPGDTSVVGWQIMALKSGHMASLAVNPLTIKKAISFLNYVESRKGSRYGYTDGERFTASLSAVGLLCRMYLGWKKDNPALKEGVAYLARTGPSDNLYYDYYATQVMHHAEGDAWVSWNSRMKPLLLATQSNDGHEAGSWFDGVNGGHGPDVAGRLYCTSLATMILETYYRYLPIYGSESVGEEFQE